MHEDETTVLADLSSVSLSRKTFNNLVSLLLVELVLGVPVELIKGRCVD